MNEKEKQALRQWYSQEWVLNAILKAKEAEDWDTLEAHVHRNCLLPLSKHDTLPDFMRNPEGGPLFPSNLSPLQDQEGWQDAIEIGWEVVKEKLGVTMEEVQGKIRAEKDADWEVFMKSVEEREKSRKDKKDPTP